MTPIFYTELFTYPSAFLHSNLSFVTNFTTAKFDAWLRVGGLALALFWQQARVAAFVATHAAEGESRSGIAN